MMLTDVRRTKRGRISLYVDDAFAFTISPELLVRYKLEPGTSVVPELLHELEQAEALALAKQRAFRMLSMKDYTQKQLYDKLSDAVGGAAAEVVVEQMKGYGYVNDADYADRCARDLVNRRGFSLENARRELIHRGIDPAAAAEALAQFDDQQEDERIAAVVKKKYLSMLRTERGYNRAVNGLVRLGYGYGDIRRVLRGIMENEDEYGD